MTAAKPLHTLLLTIRSGPLKDEMRFGAEMKVAGLAFLLAMVTAHTAVALSDLGQTETRVHEQAVLYELDAGGTGQATKGFVAWAVERRDDEEPGLSASAQFGSDQPKLHLFITKIEDQEIPANLLIEITFTGASASNIIQVPGLALKPKEPDRGSPFFGVPITIKNGLFWIAVSADPAHHAANLVTAHTSRWIDVPFKVLNGSWALITLEISQAASLALVDLLSTEARPTQRTQRSGRSQTEVDQHTQVH